MKIGNINISKSGKYITGVQPHKAVLTGLIMTVPNICSATFLAYVAFPFHLTEIVVVLNVVLLFVNYIFIVLTSITEPGILPTHDLQINYVDQITKIIFQQYLQQQCNNQLEKSRMKILYSKNEFKNQQQYQQFINLTQKSAAYQVLKQTHDYDNYELIIKDNGVNIQLKYCNTCKFFRPLRCVHSSKSNVCIQRYDHFCDWLGTDIGLHNHGYFLIMIITMNINLIFQLIFCIIALGCSIANILCMHTSLSFNRENFTIIQNQQIEISYFSLALFTFLVIYNILVLKAVYQLLAYHIKLIKTNTLTKEDSGPLNTKVSQIYNYFNFKKNISSIFLGLKQQHIICKFIQEQNKLKKLLQKNILIGSFDHLGKKLKLNGVESFQNLEIKPPSKRGQMSRSLAMIMDEGKLTQNLERINFQKIFTARNCYEFAINRSRLTICQTQLQIKRIRELRPEIFKYETNIEEWNNQQLDAVKMCKKKQEVQKSNVTHLFLNEQTVNSVGV